MNNKTEINSTLINDGDNYSNSLHYFEIFIIILNLITVVTGLFGNTLVCYVVFISKVMKKTSTNLLLANLAIVDIIGVMTIAGQYSICYKSLVDNWKTFETMCAINKSFHIIGYYVARLLVTEIAFDRFMLIHYPHKKRHVKLIISIIWSFSIVFVSLTSVSMRIVTLSFTTYPSFFECRTVLIMKNQFLSNLIRDIRVSIINLLLYAIPMIITTLLYAKILHTNWKRNVGDMIETQIQNLTVMKWRTTKMLIVVTLLFVLCWLPFYIFNCYNYFIQPPTSCVPTPLYLTLTWFGMSSCSCNPFVYWWLNDQFRAGARRIWYYIICKARKRERSVSTIPLT